MKKELDDLLCQRYPELFAERGMTIQESCMGRGIECNDGWFDLIDAFCEEVQKWVKKGAMPPVVLKQIKQKWGILVIHFDGGNEVTRGQAQMAEAMSARICEICGQPGEPGLRPRDKMHTMTRCKEHMKEGYGATHGAADNGGHPVA